MMKIKDILYVSTALLLLACSNEEKFSSETLSGGEKTPLLIEATLSTGNATTRAEGMDFAKDDVLWAYLRHTTGPKEDGAYPTIAADKAPLLASFTIKDGFTMSPVTYSGETVIEKGTGDFTDASKLYWDDFSNSASADTDLRTPGHGLQSYYGYCYNGGATGDGTTVNGNITTALVTTEGPTAGTLGWKVGTPSGGIVNQNVGNAIQHADLLWSKEQETVEYSHSTTHGGDHHTLTIPYTHAMSEITVTVIAEDGYTGSPLTNTILTLNNMNTKVSLDAPNATFSSSGTPAQITMFKGDYESGGSTCDFTAIVAPGTRITDGDEFLNIVEVEDNNYTLTINGNMLTEDTWLSGHTTEQYGTDTNDKKYVVTQPGVNYHLTVTVKKTEVQTKATLANWREVNARGNGTIKFNDDAVLIMEDDKVPEGQQNVEVKVVDNNSFKNGSSFSLFMLQNSGSYSTEGNRVNDAYTLETVSTFVDNSTGNDQWTNSPAIYWPNKSNSYFFRAIAKFKGAIDKSDSSSGKENDIVDVGMDTETATAVSQGYNTESEIHDIIWGTTAKHYGTTSPEHTPYARGQAIPPRTGGVPIAFEHVMSKVSFTLETTNDASKVDLTDATIAVSNLYTTGTITIETGTVILPGNKTANAILATPWPISELIVIPQTIGETSIVTITLKDGTVYKLQLNLCKTGGATTIGEWERGKYYSYTIHLEKEQITFRALVKDWDKVEGSGNATLEWD